MTKVEYIKWRADPKADTMDGIFFYYLLNGGKVKDKQQFSDLLEDWLLKLGYGSVLALQRNWNQLLKFTITKLNEYYGTE